MVLLDLTPANLEVAAKRIRRAGVRRRVKEIVEGSIVDLSRFPDGVFDAVLCTGGPLSHVLDPREREQAICELVRVAKPGAPLFVSVISRLAVMVWEMMVFPHEIEEPLFKAVRDTGDYFGDSGFTPCHFFFPEELPLAFAGQPVEVLEMVGLQGLSSHHIREFNRLAKNPQRFAIWMETHLQTCTYPATVGMSEHILIVCRKKL
jgi:SAM-dependent methyltransferase